LAATEPPAASSSETRGQTARSFFLSLTVLAALGLAALTPSEASAFRWRRSLYDGGYYSGYYAPTYSYYNYPYYSNYYSYSPSYSSYYAPTYSYPTTSYYYNPGASYYYNPGASYYYPSWVNNRYIYP
jgi:hypothetical protein